MRRRCPSCLASGVVSSTRLRISAAALHVKVMARRYPGPSTDPSRLRQRRPRSSVLPEPAGAVTMNERPGSRAASRAAASGRSLFFTVYGQELCSYPLLGKNHVTIQLYDLAAAEDDRRFSPYCWRTKMALKHKGLEFETLPWRFTEKERIESPAPPPCR